VAAAIKEETNSLVGVDVDFPRQAIQIISQSHPSSCPYWRRGKDEEGRKEGRKEEEGRKETIIIIIIIIIITITEGG